ADLRQKLSGYLSGEKDVEDLYRGQVKKGEKDALSVIAADEELREAIAKWVDRRKYGKLLDLWAKGLSFDWNTLYAGPRPKRISLPTYPFARERYWVPAAAPKMDDVGSGKAGGSMLHPLVHQNTSDLLEQRFSSTFTGEEFFLRDHVVQGSRVLPGVAYLEMARAAVTKAAGDVGDGSSGILLRQVVWARPVHVDAGTMELHIGLHAEADGSISYEIYSGSAGGGEGKTVLHAQGVAVLQPSPERPVVDLSLLQSKCVQRTMSLRDCYAAHEAMGLAYGESHQGLRMVQIGVDDAGEAQVLAQLELPAGMVETADRYVLHPSIMDAALQASIGLAQDGAGAGAKPFLPFAVDEVEIFAPSPARGWAWVRYAGGRGAESAVEKLDIDVADESGVVCVRLRGFT
ncbi:polyketide synthase dehydratase domain-containing protein, partial [Bradyrhizobium sp. SZCCHNS1012]|uniref:polyketide synthase dehydratase domain-containing protein n=1 Tax=Bradyrhizobium sp. SZCCHNS1012 TaxID=3057297 RepID=UPI002916A363